MCFRYECGHLILSFIFVAVCIKAYPSDGNKLICTFAASAPSCKQCMGLLQRAVSVCSHEVISLSQAVSSMTLGHPAIRMSVKNYAVNLVFVEMTKKIRENHHLRLFSWWKLWMFLRMKLDIKSLHIDTHIYVFSGISCALSGIYSKGEFLNCQWKWCTENNFYEFRIISLNYKPHETMVTPCEES